MASRIMSDAEIRRRKKVQGHVSQATGALGLAAFGGTLAASRGGRQALRRIPQLKNKVAAPKELEHDRDRIKGVVTPALAGAAGLGALGSFNFASYTGAEARKRGAQKPKTVTSKRVEDGMEMGYYGEEGHPVELEPIPVEVEKAWSPSASNFDSERSRGKRAKVMENGALVGAGAGAAAAGHQGYKAAKVRPGKLKDPGSHVVASVREVESGGKIQRKVSSSPTNHWKAVSLEDFKAHKEAGKVASAARKTHGRNAAIGAGVAAAGVGAHRAVRHRRTNDSGWQPYAKSATSAFGIEHGTEWTAP